MQLDEKIRELSRLPIPRHIGIIMDGNGRWAKERGRPRTYGHQQGVETVDRIVTFASRLGIGALTLYSFSAENWKRPPSEVGFLMNLLTTYLKIKLQKFIRNNIRFRAIGRLDGLDPAIRNLINDTIRRTEGNTGLVLNLALNYSGRQEIVDAVKKILLRNQVTPLTQDEITEEMFSQFLYDPELPDPELIIRTSRELRVSNFLLWQIAYSEFWFTDKYWPDFSEEDMVQAIEDFIARDRRYGGVTNAG